MGPSDVDRNAAPRARFGAVWRNVLEHLAADSVRARFLLQVEASPYAGMAHAALVEDGEDPLLAAASAPDMTPLLADVPPEILYDLAFGPALRLAARAVGSPDLLDRSSTERLIDACWRAITRP